jgi:hypothetical protein
MHGSTDIIAIMKVQEIAPSFDLTASGVHPVNISISVNRSLCIDSATFAVWSK